MTLKAQATPLVISLAQGSADAFVQGSVLTGLAGRQAYRLAGVSFGFTNAGLAVLAATTVWEVYLTITRRSKAAIPDLSDNDVLMRWSAFNQFTTSGASNFDGDYYWTPPLEIAIVEDTVYAQFDSTGIGTACGMAVRIDVDLDTISDIDRLNLITRSLT